MKNNRKIIYILYSVILFLIFAGFMYLAVLVNTAPRIDIVQKGDVTENDTNQDMCITMPIAKGWIDRGYHANQYDAVLYNNTKSNINNWTVTVTFPEASSIQDQWNIVYEKNEDGSVTISNNTEQGFNDIIFPGKDVTFGIILFSYDDYAIPEFHITGVPEPQITDYPLFYVLCVLFALFLFCAIVSAILSAKERQYKQRSDVDKQIIVQTMKTFSNFIDEKDPYTRGHSIRVAFYTRKIAEKMDFDEEEMNNIYYIALLHDVGKIYIPDEILNKPSKLTTEEMDIIKTHTSKGAAILRDFSSIPDIVDGANYHHERYDGKGYPAGLVGEEIPLIARIIGVADAYDAMNSDRVYRKAFPKDKIISELKENSGLQFDPEIVKIMLDLLEHNAFGDSKDM